MRSKLAPFAIVVVAAATIGLSGCSAGTGGTGDAKVTTITFGNWRTEDAKLWESSVIPAFEKAHPEIKVTYQATSTNDYNAAIQSKVESGTGPDVIMCRPFDVNRAWIEKGYFDNLKSLTSISNFTPTALAAWTGADGDPYCMPIASVLAGFYYNKTIFKELGLSVPTTMAEFTSDLKKIKANGKYTPLALGSADGWQLAYNVLDSIGPNYWQGEAGRLGLIDGTKKLTDPDFVAATQAFADLKPYLPDGYQSLKYEDMMQLFTLGKAAIIPDGSWDVTAASATGLDIGVFAAPVVKAGDQRYLQEMPDQGVGLNAKSKNKTASKVFLEWLGTTDFQKIYVDKVPGFFSMGTAAVPYTNKLSQQFADLKKGAELTPRLALDRLSAGTPPLDDDTWAVLQTVLNDGVSAEAAQQKLQTGLDSWYKPAK
ncbi:MAG: sugar transporter substrate-binding protein [Microbacteriaceae bacterium]|jgi:raffinose/stachyose/melibiose transport system substrate-binding protein|nr:sugar transporter substrate-binding protein [Microbacteriaceae bacterium]MCU1506278.1 sugar transporter substrate-binding protein [Microbacteriaceae bacterium]MDQ1577774.1 raffinose/stachyose/melibiose transport system substrate-binding protein [Microbacteriaceae bacterium]